MDLLIIGAVESMVIADAQRALVDAGHTIIQPGGVKRPACNVILIGDALSTSDAAELRAALMNKNANLTDSVGLRFGEELDVPDDVIQLLTEVHWVAIGKYPAIFANLVAEISRRENRISSPRSDARGFTEGGLEEVAGSDPDSTAEPSRSRQPLRVLRRKRNKKLDAEQSRSGQSIFVSYSRRDKLATDVINELRHHGHDVWVDTSSIPGGADWRKSIQGAIEQCEVFVLLLSPNVSRSPKYVWTEVGYAESLGKCMIPVRLKKTSSLPDGFNFVLSAHNYVDLFPDFQTGMGMLLAALGAASGPAELSGLMVRTKRASERTKIWMHQHDVASKAKRYGGTAATVAAVVGLAMAKEMAKQKGMHLDEINELERRQLAALNMNRKNAKELEERKALSSRRTYADSASKLLGEAANEILFTEDMTTVEYRTEFRPRFMYLLGQLESMRPDEREVAIEHDKLIKGLKDLLESMDVTARTADEGDGTGYQRALKRYGSRLADLLSSQQSWLRAL